MKRAITRAIFELAAASYREHPGHHAAAGRAAGIDRRTARKLWSRGLPALGLASVERLLADEQVMLRGRLNREEAHARLIAMSSAEDAQAVMAKEILLSRELAQMALRLGNDLAQADVSQLPVAEKLDALGKVVRIAQMMAGASRDCLEIERARGGDPAAVAQVEVERELSLEEWRDSLRAANDALDRFEEMQAVEAQATLLLGPGPGPAPAQSAGSGCILLAPAKVPGDP